MNISDFSTNPQGFDHHMYQGIDGMLTATATATTTATSFSTSFSSSSSSDTLLFDAIVLGDKIQHLESYVNAIISFSYDQIQHDQETALISATAASLAQEIIVTASSTMYTINDMEKRSREVKGLPSNGWEIIEVDVAEILARYSYYCQVCGKGFKRDANLRMHMRAHGDEYKSTASLRNPMAAAQEGSGLGVKKYSCPHEGCRWNKKHPKFQPLKYMVCMKNHYKRSHCPKMYVCKRCNHKQFSVLSDLRTHEKHCGDLRWRCSCGTNFSRKDKLMGHIDLFGHVPVIGCLAK